MSYYFKHHSFFLSFLSFLLDDVILYTFTQLSLSFLSLFEHPFSHSLSFCVVSGDVIVVLERVHANTHARTQTHAHTYYREKQPTYYSMELYSVTKGSQRGSHQIDSAMGPSLNKMRRNHSNEYNYTTSTILLMRNTYLNSSNSKC